MPDIGRREILGAIGIAAVVVAISSVPYLLGYLSATPDTEFGGFLIDLDDSYSYLAKMQQGVWDGWRYRIPFTPEKHPGAYLYTFYLGLGKLSSLLGLSLMQTYQFARLACGLALLVMAYIFVSTFLENRDRRLVAYLLISFSSGLGWLVVLVGGPSTLRGIAPIDFWWIEAYTFLTILTFPHFAAALTLLLLFFTLALRYLETFRLPALLLGIPTFVALCIVHPYNAFLVDGVLAAYWVLLFLKRKRMPRREALSIMIWAVTPIPLLAYYYRALTSDPVFQSWAAQTVLPSPSVPHLFLGYGFVFLMAIGGLAHAIRERDERSMLLVSWVTSIMVLTYSPLSFQRKMVEGLHVPLCILATVGLFEYLLPRALRSDWLTRFALARVSKGQTAPVPGLLSHRSHVPIQPLVAG
jgi:MFS family permease